MLAQKILCLIFSSYVTKNLSRINLKKDLGVYIQSDLKWTNQVKYCTSRGNRILGMIAKSFRKLNIDTLRML